MFNRKTVFVLGAGSSEEVGFPLGKALAQKIGRKMDIRFEHGFRPLGDGDFELFGQITHQRQNERQQFQQAAWLIRDGIGLAQSIDDFLDQHRSNTLANQYGKAAIVNAILEAENASKLYFNPFETGTSFAITNFADSWFVKFTYMLARGIPKEDIKTIFERVSFVIFNYDRCVEFFLLNALQLLYRVAEAEAKSVLSTLRIIHPYGAVPPHIPFGHKAVNCAQLIGSIKTYTEQIADPTIVKQVATELEQAEHIVFLGFAYHDQNMALLRPPNTFAASKEVFGTAYGMSDSDVNVVGHQIDAWFTGRNATAYRSSMIKLENKLKCASLFDNYAKSLTGR
jgi:hypothetical protein